jgi:hypothetical protein
VQSGTVWLWGVQLEVGSVATPLEKPDPQQDLAKAQRFYQSHTALYMQEYTVSAAGMAMDFSLPVTMRAPPTTTLANVTYSNASAAALNSSQQSHIRLTAVVTTTGTGWTQFDLQLSADL